jgi:exodeoxyribonuclease V alpha subunit
MTEERSHQVLPVKASMTTLVSYIAHDEAFRGIGPRRAAALGAAFGQELLEAITRCDERVIEIVGEEAAIRAAAVVEARKAEAALLAWLDSKELVIPTSQATRIARAWGPQGVARIEANPYLLLAVSDWKTVEAIARACAVGEADSRRDVAAVEAALTGKRCLARGATRISQWDAEKAAARLLKRPLDEGAIEMAIRAGGAIRLGNALQPPGAAYMEAACALTLMRLSSQAPVGGATSSIELDRLLMAYEGRQRFTLTNAQRAAIRMAHQCRLSILAGYAGSGKTTVLRGVCDTLEAAGRKPLIITLSGRAAQRATEATGRRAITVARYLMERERAQDRCGVDQALIADEASMLGLVDFWRLLRRKNLASILLCGDPAQLPPISPGVVFHRLAVDQFLQRVTLDRVHRQDEKTGIPALAEGVRRGRIGSLPAFRTAEPGVTFTNCARGSLPVEVLRVGKVLREAGTDRDDMQIIAPTNREIDAINSHFHGLRRRQSAILWPRTGHIAEGEPVIWNQNHPERGLTNGSMGRITRIRSAGISAILDGVNHELAPEDGKFLQLAYAISVHKAQGSQWRRIIVPIYYGRALDRSLVYTALTRAEEQVILLGDQSALRRAVGRPSAAEQRDCGFGTWLDLARIFSAEEKREVA